MLGVTHRDRLVDERDLDTVVRVRTAGLTLAPVGAAQVYAEALGLYYFHSQLLYPCGEKRNRLVGGKCARPQMIENKAVPTELFVFFQEQATGGVLSEDHVRVSRFLVTEHCIHNLLPPVCADRARYHLQCDVHQTPDHHYVIKFP